MSFEGSLNTVGLADVLTLLATSAKSGELQVNASGVSGRVWLKNGRLTGSDDGQGSGHPDAIFHLLGLTSGTFCFDQGTEAPAPGRPFEVGPLLVAAAHRLEQWDEIRAVIPSNTAVATMAPAAAHRHLIVSSLQWSILVAIAGGRPVGDVIRAVQLSEFEGSVLLKEMVEAELIAVAMPPALVGSGAGPAPGAVPSSDPPVPTLAAAALADPALADPAHTTPTLASPTLAAPALASPTVEPRTEAAPTIAVLTAPLPTPAPVTHVPATASAAPRAALEGGMGLHGWTRSSAPGVDLSVHAGDAGRRGDAGDPGSAPVPSPAPAEAGERFEPSTPTPAAERFEPSTPTPAAERFEPSTPTLAAEPIEPSTPAPPKPPAGYQPSGLPAPPEPPAAGRSWMAALAASAAGSGSDPTPAPWGAGATGPAGGDGPVRIPTADGVAEADAAGQEPINRGLLLKFLSSVRS